MALICVHRAPRTPPDSTPGHIGSRDGLQEEPRPATDLPRTALRARLVHGTSLSCNSPGTRIGLPGPSRAHPPARWHRFVSIERREPLQTALQGILTSAMFCRKIADLPRTCHARSSEPGPTLSCNSPGKAIAILRASRAYPLARWHRFVSIERLEPCQTALQGTFARAMFCRKLAVLTQNCLARPSELGQSPVPHFPAIHLARQSPFYGPPGHISPRDGIDLCPSSAANPSRQPSRAYPLARCFAGSSPNDMELPRKAVRARLVPNSSRSCNSPGKAIGLPEPYRAHPPAR